MNADRIFALAPVASFQNLGDGAVILLADSGQLYSCNETTEAFLQKVDGTRTLGEIVDLMALEYDVVRETLAADMGELAAELEQEGIIVCRSA